MKTTKITVVSSNGASVLTVGTFPVTVSVFKTWIKAGNFNATVRVVNDHLFVYCKDEETTLRMAVGKELPIALTALHLKRFSTWQKYLACPKLQCLFVDHGDRP